MRTIFELDFFCLFFWGRKRVTENYLKKLLSCKIKQSIKIINLKEGISLE